MTPPQRAPGLFAGARLRPLAARRGGRRAARPVGGGSCLTVYATRERRRGWARARAASTLLLTAMVRPEMLQPLLRAGASGRPGEAKLAYHRARDLVRGQARQGRIDRPRPCPQRGVVVPQRPRGGERQDHIGDEDGGAPRRDDAARHAEPCDEPLRKTTRWRAIHLVTPGLMGTPPVALTCLPAVSHRARVSVASGVAAPPGRRRTPATLRPAATPRDRGRT